MGNTRQGTLGHECPVRSTYLALKLKTRRIVVAVAVNSTHHPAAANDERIYFHGSPTVNVVSVFLLVTMVRTTTYGGKAGIFVKRSSKPKISIQIPTTQGNDSQYYPSVGRITPSPTMTTIGWDPIKCRPIYQDEDETNKSHKNQDNKDDKEHKPVSVSKPTETTRRTARAYGSKAPSTCLLAIGTPTQQPNPQQQSQQQGHFMLTPVTLDISICDALNSVSKPPSPKQESNHTTKIEERQPGQKSIISKKRKEHCNNNNYHKKRTCLDFYANTQQQQPTCTTSIDSAKAFFDRLDKTQELVITQGTTPIAPRRACIRTLRPANIEDCRQEYNLYVQALTGVSSPLPMKHFAFHRAEFFATKKLCFDGFLDDH